jgi:hypothetical protein
MNNAGAVLQLSESEYRRQIQRISMTRHSYLLRLLASTTISIINYTAEMLCLYLTNIE